MRSEHVEQTGSNEGVLLFGRCCVGTNAPSIGLERGRSKMFQSAKHEPAVAVAPALADSSSSLPNIGFIGRSR